ncbi:MAG: hypothetical protein RL648_1423, partial [Verrucomicrobiota bacterium]
AMGPQPEEDVAGVDQEETIHGFRIDFNTVRCFLVKEMQLDNRHASAARLPHA